MYILYTKPVVLCQDKKLYLNVTKNMYIKLMITILQHDYYVIFKICIFINTIQPLRRAHSKKSSCKLSPKLPFID